MNMGLLIRNLESCFPSVSSSPNVILFFITLSFVSQKPCLNILGYFANRFPQQSYSERIYKALMKLRKLLTTLRIKEIYSSPSKHFDGAIIYFIYLGDSALPFQRAAQDSLQLKSHYSIKKQAIKNNSSSKFIFITSVQNTVK